MSTENFLICPKDLENLVYRLRSHVERLANSLKLHADAINDLRQGKRRSEFDHVSMLREAVDVLTGEVDEVREVIGQLEVERDRRPIPSGPASKTRPTSPYRQGYTSVSSFDWVHFMGKC